MCPEVPVHEILGECRVEKIVHLEYGWLVYLVNWEGDLVAKLPVTLSPGEAMTIRPGQRVNLILELK